MVAINSHSRSIQHLPRELLEIIFDIHVNRHYASRYPLLLTSRTWYTIATTYPALWTSICCTKSTTKIPETVLCPDLQSLAVVINRTGGSQFDLYLGETFTQLKTKDLEAFIDSVDKTWLSRCRALTIFAQVGRGNAAETMGARFFAGNLSSLKSLHISHRYGERNWESLLQSIMEKIDCSALDLRRLRVQILESRDEGSAGWITQGIYRWPRVLQRLTHVNLPNTDEPIPWAYFTNIEDIEVSCSEGRRPLVALDIPPVYHLTLGRIRHPSDLILTKIWQSLTHLTIKDSVDEFGPFNLQLPSLISLRIIVCAFDLQYIDAPRLEELTIRLDITDDYNDVYRELEDTLFTPRILHIDVQAAEFPTQGLKVFATKHPLWGKVEELHLRLLGETHYLDTVLINALCGLYPEHCYPKLHSMTVLFPVLEASGIYGDAEEENEALKKGAIRELTSIARGRATRTGMSPLRDLEAGWYIEYGDDPFQPEWRVIEWRDCLDGHDDNDEDWEDEEDEGSFSASS